MERCFVALCVCVCVRTCVCVCACVPSWVLPPFARLTCPSASAFPSVDADAVQTLRVVDPRSGEVSGEVQAHSALTAWKVHWSPDRDHIISVGYGRGSKREIKVWDPRSLAEPLYFKPLGLGSVRLGGVVWAWACVCVSECDGRAVWCDGRLLPLCCKQALALSG